MISSCWAVSKPVAWLVAREAVGVSKFALDALLVIFVVLSDGGAAAVVCLLCAERVE